MNGENFSTLSFAPRNLTFSFRTCYQREQVNTVFPLDEEMYFFNPQTSVYWAYCISKCPKHIWNEYFTLCISHFWEHVMSKTVLSFYHRFTLLSVSGRSAKRTTASRYACHHVHSQTLCRPPRGSRVACLCLVCLSESQATANFFFFLINVLR